jgi:hypothetical protein
MCYPVVCKKCGKTSWGGCGAHVQSVMQGIPEDKRCKCERKNEKKAESQSIWQMFRKG